MFHPLLVITFKGTIDLL